MSESDQIEYHRSQLMKDGLARRKKSQAGHAKKMKDAGH